MEETKDAQLARFLALHAQGVVDEVEADVADYRGTSLKERWQATQVVCSSLSMLASWPAERRARYLEDREEPHPSYAGIVARLRGEP